MRRTPVYIVCSPRPGIGKTLVARQLTEFLLLKHGQIAAFDINLSDPSLVDFLPDVTETASISDTFGQIALMDRLILNDGLPKVIDLGFHAFGDFYKMIGEIGFILEGARRGVDPVILFMADADRASTQAWAMLRRQFPRTVIVPINNEYVLRSGVPDSYAAIKPVSIAALPAFLKSVIWRTNFSFTGYLRSNDSSSELYKWTQTNYIQFRELEDLILHGTQR